MRRPELRRPYRRAAIFAAMAAFAAMAFSASPARAEPSFAPTARLLTGQSAALARLGMSLAELTADRGFPARIAHRAGEIDDGALIAFFAAIHPYWTTCDDTYDLNTPLLLASALALAERPVRRPGTAFAYEEADYVFDDSGRVAWIELREESQGRAFLPIGPGSTEDAVTEALGRPDHFLGGDLLYSARQVGTALYSLTFGVDRGIVRSVRIAKPR